MSAPGAPANPPRQRPLRAFAGLWLAYFATIGLFNPYAPLWFKDLGFSTVVIGGIYIQEVGNNTTKVPLLGDIPVLGYLFRNNERKDNKTELLVFITPRIINDQLGLR